MVVSLWKQTWIWTDSSSLPLSQDLCGHAESHLLFWEIVLEKSKPACLQAEKERADLLTCYILTLRLFTFWATSVSLNQDLSSAAARFMFVIMKWTEPTEEYNKRVTWGLGAETCFTNNMRVIKYKMPWTIKGGSQYVCCTSRWHQQIVTEWPFPNRLLH